LNKDAFPYLEEEATCHGLSVLDFFRRKQYAVFPLYPFLKHVPLQRLHGLEGERYFATQPYSAAAAKNKT
jgi:hypothetical protein